MPITRKQFEIGIDSKTEDWMKKIHNFLDQHKDEAFYEEDLRKHFSSHLLEPLSGTERKLMEEFLAGHVFNIRSDELSAFSLALERLVELGAAGKSVIRGTAYYAYRQQLEEVL